MRRNGKTTRSVDRAIQNIFDSENYGRLVFPYMASNNVPVGCDGYQPGQVMVDAGVHFENDRETNNNIQKEFRNRVIKRLKSEHSHLKIDTSDDIHISIR